jgi:hypothetical protein
MIPYISILIEMGKNSAKRIFIRKPTRGLKPRANKYFTHTGLYYYPNLGAIIFLMISIDLR